MDAYVNMSPIKYQYQCVHREVQTSVEMRNLTNGQKFERKYKKYCDNYHNCFLFLSRENKAGNI